MSWTIRHATRADAGRLTRLAHAAKANWGYPSEWLAAWVEDLTLTPAYLEAHRVFVAERDGVAIGMAALEDHSDRWTLEHVWVAPAEQGRGLGRALVEHALAVAKAVRPGIVVLTADPHAADFYAHLGARRRDSLPAPMPGAPQRRLPRFEFDASDADGG